MFLEFRVVWGLGLFGHEVLALFGVSGRLGCRARVDI